MEEEKLKTQEEEKKENPVSDAKESVSDDIGQSEMSEAPETENTAETAEETAEEATPEQKVEELEKEVAELKDQYLRKCADFENYRKRMFREKQEAFDYANTNLLTDLIAVLDDFDRALAEQLHRDYRKIKNLTPEKQLEFSRVYNKAFVDWTNARKNSDFSLFADSLQKVKDVTLEDLSLREKDEETKNMSVMDELLNDYERGMGVTLGRLREDTIFDYKFVGLSHNTLRGAAGGAVLMAELLKAKGYLG